MRNETKAILLLILTLIFLIGNLILLGFYGKITGKTIENRYSFTKAICTENYCEDYNISCVNNKVEKIISTGSAVQFSNNWQDNRSEEEINRLC